AYPRLTLEDVKACLAYVQAAIAAKEWRLTQRHVVAADKVAKEVWQRTESERGFWQAHERDYLDKYPNEFIALQDGQVIVHETNLDELVAELEEQDLSLHLSDV